MAEYGREQNDRESIGTYDNFSDQMEEYDSMDELEQFDEDRARIPKNGPLDPQNLLKALSELLDQKGAISGATEAVRVASLMKDANKIVSRCVYINILRVDTEKKTMEKLLQSGGWETLNNWLQDSKDDENYPLLAEILKVYHILPVTVDILKTNNAAKTIKQLCKSDNENVKSLANRIFEDWMKKVKGNNNSNDDKVKKRKEKEFEKDEDRSSSSSKKSDSSNDKREHKSKNSPSKSTLNESSNRDKVKKLDSMNKNMERHDRQIENRDSNDIVHNEEKLTVWKGTGLKLHIKLGGDKERTEGKNIDGDVKKRASTVKRPPSKFRSTGLEEGTSTNSTLKLPQNADLSKPIPKRTGSLEDKTVLPSKKARLHLPSPLIVAPSTTVVAPVTTVTTPSIATPPPPSPVEMPGRIKLIPPRPRSNHAIHESTGFMDSLETSTRTYGAYKKKRRPSVTGTPTSANNSKGQVAPSTPPSPVSPTTAIAKSLPSVPSFYKDTQQEIETSPEKDTKVKKEKSPSPTEKMDVTESTAVDIVKEDSSADTSKEVKTERSPSPTESTCSSTKESKGLLTTGATKVKKTKKTVSWKDDSILKVVFYFELDEEERVNVNRPKDFNQAKKAEMMFDRKAVESVRRMHHDHMIEQIIWYRPKQVKDYKQFDYGKESKEKSVQKLREQSVLQALFFNKTMLPDNPQEPEMENEELTEPKLILLDDVSGGEEFLYNYETHPQAINVNGPPPPAHVALEPPPINSYPPPLQLQGPPPPPPPQHFSVPSGLNLPPEIMHLLGQIQNSPANPNDPMMVHVQQLLNNIVCGIGDHSSYEQLQQIQQMMNSGPMVMPPDGLMQGPPLGMPPMGMMPPGVPPVGSRTLLGAAPPGFMPPRPMGPGPPLNRFGPPGQGPPGNWGQNMGGPNLGPPGNWMRGPRPGGRGGRGGGGRFRRVLCRHFASGSCRIGADCDFLHPGINGPPMNNFNMPGNGEQQMVNEICMDS